MPRACTTAAPAAPSSIPPTVPTSGRPAAAEPARALVAYLRDRGLRTELRVVGTDGEGDRRVAGPVGSGVRYAYECGYARDVEWSPDGRRIAFTSGDSCASQVHVVNADGTNLRPLTPGIGPSWSPAGDRIAFVENFNPGGCPPACGRRLGVVDVITAEVDWLVEGDAVSLGEPAWSPDGASLAVTAYGDGGGSDVLVVDAATGVAARVAHGASPDWSPDGSRLAYARWEGSAPEGLEQRLFTTSADGADESQVGVGVGPAWSPDGELIGFVKLRVSSDTGIAVAPPDGGFVRELASDALGHASDTSSVDWSPDGEQLVFNVFERERRSDVIFVVDVDGGGDPIPIAQGVEPAWQPAHGE